MEKFKIISSEYFTFYNKKQKITLQKHFRKLKEKSTSGMDGFNFSFVSSSVYSSMIEGSGIDIDTYFRYRDLKVRNKSFKEIQDLIEAYKFAKSNKLTLSNVMKAHSILSKTLLINNPEYVGKIRNKMVTVRKDGVIIYTACPTLQVKSELNKLFSDITVLIKADLTISEVFYYASMIHLRFVQIHPFGDGNGRVTRLIEKWFLAEKLGSRAWFIQSEKMYQKRILFYYKNIDLGESYDKLNYDLSIPFLIMLPISLRTK
jgi:Fic family protein